MGLQTMGNDKERDGHIHIDIDLDEVKNIDPIDIGLQVDATKKT